MNSETLLKTISEQQSIIEQQSRLIAELSTTLESLEQIAGYENMELKQKIADMQEKEKRENL